MDNIPVKILRLAEERGRRLAFQMQREAGGYRSTSWRQFHEQSLKLAFYLQSKGVGPAERVLLLSENCPEWPIAAMAVMSLGATLVPVAAMATSLELENILKTARPKFSIFSSRATSVKALDPALLGDFLLWDSQDENPLEDVLKNSQRLQPNFGQISADAVAILIFTSGTTGHPKGVPLTHKNILTNAADIIQTISASDKDSTVSVLPLSHMLEFTGGFIIASLVGAKVTYVKSLKAEDLLLAMRDTQATILLAVPLLFEIMARNMQTRMAALPSWIQSMFRHFAVLVRKNRALGPLLFFPLHKALGGKVRFFVAGGSKLQPTVYEFFKGLGIPLLQGYGLSETSPVLAITNEKNVGPDHVGLPLRSVELGIFNDSGQRVSMGAEGEIWARGPSVFAGYLDPAHNQGVFFDGWFRTGDLGVVATTGQLSITGRKKDIIVTGAGKNVYPEEIESVLAATGFFLEVCALGLAGTDGHEKVAVAVVPDRVKLAKEFATRDSADLEAAARRAVVTATRALSDYKWPQRIELFYEELPKTGTRKVKKHEVRALIQRRDEAKSVLKGQGDLAMPDICLRMEDDLERTLAQSIAAIARLAPQDIKRAASLARDFGLDSLLLVEVIGAVEKNFQHNFEAVDFSEVDTVADLLSVLSQSLGEAKQNKKRHRIWFSQFHPEDSKAWFWRLPRSFLNACLRLWMKGAYAMHVEGLENISGETESLVIAPNHSSHFDTLTIFTALPKERIHATYPVAAKDYFFDKSWKSLVSRVLINAVPFDRKSRVEEGMAKCREVLHARDSLVIFPEGTRSTDGKLQTFKPGVGQLLAAQKKVKAVPVYIFGAYEIMPKGKNIPALSGKLRVRFGKPVSYAHLPPTQEAFKKIAADLQARVTQLGKE